MRKPSISFIIPTYNNNNSIRFVLAQTVAMGKMYSSDYEILVVNDGSTDQTEEIIKKYQKNQSQIRLMTHAENKGYGATIRELYLKASKDWIYSTPGDNQIHPDQIGKLIPYMNEADMIIGWRNNRHDPTLRLIESWVYNMLLKLCFGVKIHDVNSVRLMKRKVLNSMILDSYSAFVDGELVIKAQRKGWRVIEAPIDHQKNEKKGSGGSMKTIIPTIIDMIRVWL